LLIQLGDEGEGMPHTRPALLSWLARAPAKELEDVRLLASLGENVIEALLPPVRDCVADAGGGGSLETIHNAGRRLATVLARVDEEPL
jgi:hypothetical protein